MNSKKNNSFKSSKSSSIDSIEVVSFINNSLNQKTKKKKSIFILFISKISSCLFNRIFLFLMIIINFIILKYFISYVKEELFYRNFTLSELRDELYEERRYEVLKNKNITESIKLVQDNLTLVTCLFKVGNRHDGYNSGQSTIYYKWTKNLLRLDRPIVFFTQPEIIDILKPYRPRRFDSKTVWIGMNISDFYTYKNYYKEIKKSSTFNKVGLNSFELMLVYNEKMDFMKKAIEKNYFNSYCFYWIDAGYFRGYTMTDSRYIVNHWPSTDYCFKDPRVLFKFYRAPAFPREYIKNFKKKTLPKKVNFDNTNTPAGVFGGQKENLLKFHNYYYQTLEEWAKNDIYVGREENIMFYVIWKHQETAYMIGNKICPNYNYDLLKFLFKKEVNYKLI